MLVLQLSDAAAENQLECPDHKHIFRSGVLTRLLMVLESEGGNSGSDEINALREIRNAVIHNSSDLSKNHNKNSLSLVQSYLAELENGHVLSAAPSSEPLRVPFSLFGSVVKFDKGSIGEFCRQIYLKSNS